jgi:hypothetical protein
MASMATGSVKLLAVIAILLAVFAQEAVAGKTHYLDWEVSPLEINLTATCTCLVRSENTRNLCRSHFESSVP